MKNLVQRTVFEPILKHLSEKEVTIIIGPRQTGKTTLLFQIRDYLIDINQVSSSQIKFFNLDLITDLQGIGNQSDFIKFLKEELSKEKFLFVFIDEVQRLENPGKFLKGIYDLNLPIKFIVSGSSSLELKSKIFESLAGRKRIFHLWPFSFSEYISWYEPPLLNLIDKKDISFLNKKKILDYFYNFVIFGGYPRVVLAKNNEEKIKILNEIYSSYIERDIIGFIKIRNPLVFTKLVGLLGDQIGNLVNLKEISNTLAINFRTLENYLYVLENTFVINLLRPYFTNARKELTKMPKVYFVDNGLRNLTVKYFTDFLNNRDRGELLENFVHSSLLKCWEGTINYWRTKDKSEVDFVLRDYYGNVTPIEAKATELRKAEISRGLRSFIERYKPKKALVINLSLEKEVRINNTKVVFLLPYRLKFK